MSNNFSPLSSAIHKFIDEDGTPERKALNQAIAIIQLFADLVTTKSKSLKKQCILLLHDLGVISMAQTDLIIKHSGLAGE